MTINFSHLLTNPTLDFTWQECLDILHLENPAPGEDIYLWRQAVLIPAYRNQITAPEYDPRARRAFELLNFYYQGPPKPVAPKPVALKRIPKVVYKIVDEDKHLDDLLQELRQESPQRGDRKALWFQFTVGPSTVKIKGITGARRFLRVLKKNNTDYRMELL